MMLYLDESTLVVKYIILDNQIYNILGPITVSKMDVLSPSSPIQKIYTNRYHEHYRRAEKKLSDIKKNVGKKFHSSRGEQTLFTLLYLALMMKNIEELKLMLKTEDSEAYDDWKNILDQLHSPEFCTGERTLQNNRTQTIFKRKTHYKKELEDLQKRFDEHMRSSAEHRNNTDMLTRQLSDSITNLSEDNSRLKDKVLETSELKVILSRVESKLGEKELVINQLNNSIKALSDDNNNLKDKVLNFQILTSKVESKLDEKEAVIDTQEKNFFQLQESAKLLSNELKDSKEISKNHEITIMSMKSEENAKSKQEDMLEFKLESLRNHDNQVIEEKLNGTRVAIEQIKNLIREKEQNIQVRT